MGCVHGIVIAGEADWSMAHLSREVGRKPLVAVTEHSLETYRFSCTYCAHDYQRRETRERDGTYWVVHYRGGVPAENPTAAVFQCPGCHHNTLAVRRLAHHPLPEQPGRS
jgi:hypothetical protein